MPTASSRRIIGNWKKFMARSARHGYRIIDTIAAVIDSPLFREK